MGYTTKFSGHFTLVYQNTKNPVAYIEQDIRSRIHKLYMNDDWRRGYKSIRGGDGNIPATYCQWVFEWNLAESKYIIKWNGGEKFYLYIEWLQYILDTYLIYDGFTLSGNVQYQGEEIDDSGVITIENNKVIKTPFTKLIDNQLQSSSSINIKELEDINNELGDLMNKLISDTGILDELQDRIYDLIEKTKKK